MESVMQAAETLVRLLADAEKRESQLESAYVSGCATPEQLEELEKTRTRIDEYVATLDDLGYFNPT
jgi:hypothetical protein